MLNTRVKASSIDERDVNIWGLLLLFEDYYFPPDDNADLREAEVHAAPVHIEFFREGHHCHAGTQTPNNVVPPRHLMLLLDFF